MLDVLTATADRLRKMPIAPGSEEHMDGQRLAYERAARLLDFLARPTDETLRPTKFAPISIPMDLVQRERRNNCDIIAELREAQVRAHHAATTPDAAELVITNG